VDELGSPEGLKSWLVQRRLAHRDLEVSAEDAQRAREVRDALRTVIWAGQVNGFGNRGGLSDEAQWHSSR
jgi:hypothetical protein